MKTMKLRIITLFLIFVVAFGIVFSAMPSVAYAASASEINFDSTNVLDDLNSSTVNGEPFDITDYPYDEGKQVQVINFVEYCYSYRANQRENYGLYLYVYNPQGLHFSTDSKANKVQMAVAYDNEGNPKAYEKFHLECVSVSDGNYRNLFYKFKVIDREIDGKMFAERVNSNERRYDVSGIELIKYGNQTATEYGVNGTYYFTGYAEGYGPDANSQNTLASKVEYLETVELDVKHTFYRTQTSSKGAGYQNQLDTVYFAVPNRFLERYGTLQRIKAEWYEYKTNDIVVTSNDSFYEKALPYIGVPTGELNQYGIPPYNEEIGISLGQNAEGGGSVPYGAQWGWNLGEGYLHPACQTLYYLFKDDDIQEYDPYADIVSIGGVESNVLYEYIKNYNKTTVKGTLPIKDGTISADLFADDIDEYRKLDTEYGKIQKGYSYYDFDADVDLQKLTSWQEGNPSFWDNWINWGLWDTIWENIPEETSRTVSPIVTLKGEDLTGTNAEIADRLLINANDVNAIRSFYNTSKMEDKTVVLFRFSTSDYYSAGVDIVELGAGFLGNDKMTSGQAYRAWESVFFDFDIIQLTFNREGVYTVIPVVSSPIDVVDDITPPVQMQGAMDWWKMLIALVLVLLLIVLLYPLLPFVIQGVIWIIKLPFKAIGGLIKLLKNLKGGNDENN